MTLFSQAEPSQHPLSSPLSSTNLSLNLYNSLPRLYESVMSLKEKEFFKQSTFFFSFKIFLWRKEFIMHSKNAYCYRFHSSHYDLIPQILFLG